MAIRASGRTVLPTGSSFPVCAVPIRNDASETIQVRMMTCCAHRISPCIVQGAAKILDFTDLDTEDYSGATEITFDVWQGGVGGTSLLSYSLTGTAITLINDYTFRVSISNSDSASLPAGRHHCEAWVTLSGGERRCVGIGRFEVTDSRKHD